MTRPDTPRPPRHELDDLADALGVSLEPDADGNRKGITALAKLLDVDRATIRNWRVRGIPQHVDLDRLCIRFGLRVGTVWPGYLAAGIDEDGTPVWHDDESDPDYFTDDPPLDELEHQRKDSAA